MNPPKNKNFLTDLSRAIDQTDPGRYAEGKRREKITAHQTRPRHGIRSLFGMLALCLALSGSLTPGWCQAHEEGQEESNPPEGIDVPGCEPGPTLASDHSDYAPGTEAGISGAGFKAGEIVTVQVLHADGKPATGEDHEPWTTTADASGAIATSWHVCEDDCLGSLLELTATGNSSGLVGRVRFTDSSPPATALINSATVTGGASSQEALAATAAGYVVTLVTQATWASMTQAQFGAYDLLIIGDPQCGSTPATAAANSATWAPVVMGTAGGRTLAGNRIVIGTDPVFHDGGSYTSSRATIIRDGIKFAGKQPGRTGLYFCASCAGGTGNILTALTRLSSGSGTWTATSPPCGGAASLIASEPAFGAPDILTSASLQGWGCSVHEAWSTFPTDWNALAVATDTATKPTCGVDPNSGLSACGQAYILIAGSSIVVTSGSISVAPATSTKPAGSSHTVTAHVTTSLGAPIVGQAVTFTITGVNVGVAGTCSAGGCLTNSSGDISFTYPDTNGIGSDTIKASFIDATSALQAATAQVTWVNTNRPPVAITKDVTVSAGPTCSAIVPAVSFNNGSSDPDGDTISFSVSPVGPYPIGTTSVIVTVTDSHGAFSTSPATVTVKDVDAPVITGCPADITVYTGPGHSTCDQVATWTAPSATDCTTVTWHSTAVSGDSFPGGTTIVTYTATDSATPTPNTATCSFTVTVLDNSPPVPTLANLAAVNGQCSATVTAPTATDNCAGLVTATTTDPLVYNAQGTYTVHWIYSDAKGNITPQDQTVIVKDTVAPTPDLASLPTVNGQCSATVTAPTATDDCSGVLTATTTDPLAYNAQGTYTVHWIYNDGNGNTTPQDQTVIVKDTVAPTPVLASLPTVNGQCSASVTAPTATDDCSGLLTATTTDPIAYNAQGTYTVHWIYNDGNGNTTSQNQTVIVRDTIAPTPVLASLAAVNGQCSASVTAPQANDDCAGLVTGTTVDPLVYNNQGTYTVHWIYNDGNGNTTPQNQTVTVKDVVSPVISNCPANLTVKTGPGRSTCDQVASWIAPTASDNCTLVSFTSNYNPGAVFPVGTTTVTYKAVDGAIPAHTTTCSFTVTVKDNTPPVIICPPDVTVPWSTSYEPGKTIGTKTIGNATAIDNCDPNPIVNYTDVITNAICPLIIQRTFTASDHVVPANTSTCVQIITVNNLFAAGGVIWHQPLARNGASEDTDPGAGGTLKYRFKQDSTIPIQVHAQGCSADVTVNSNVSGKVVVFGDTDMDGVLDAGEVAINIGLNGVGSSGGVMDKIGPHLKYNLNTKTLPLTFKCYLLQITIKDNSTGETGVEILPLQIK